MACLHQNDGHHPTLSELVATSKQLKEQSVQIIRQLRAVLSQIRKFSRERNQQADSAEMPNRLGRKPR